MAARRKAATPKTQPAVLKWTEALMQETLAKPTGLFSCRKYIAVPNASWGLSWLNGHEADLIAITMAGVVHEVEVKVSAADLKADAKKRNPHNSRQVHYLWFAVPVALREKALAHVAEHHPDAGVIVVYDRPEIHEKREGRHGKPGRWERGVAVVVKEAKKRKGCLKALKTEQILKAARLTTLRYWSRAWKEWTKPNLSVSENLPDSV